MICKKFFLSCLMVVAFTAFANSQVTIKEMLHFAMGQYIKSIYDTSSKQVVFFEVIGEETPCDFKYGDISICFFNISKEKRLLHNAIKKANGRYHTMTIKYFCNDTIDFLFCKCQVTKCGKNYRILMESGGDAGYLPFIRFVYNGIHKKWDYYFAPELMKEKNIFY